MLETNKTLLRRHFDEVLNLGRLEVIDDIYAGGYVLDAPVQTEGSVQSHGETHGRDGLKRRVLLFRTAFPDIHFTIDRIVAEDNQVVVQYTFTGTQTGQFGELQPGGRTIRVTGVLVAQIEDGAIASAVSVFDSGDLMRQLAPEHTSPLHRILETLTGRHHRHAVAHS